MVKEFILDGQQYRINSDGSSVTVTGSEKDFIEALIISPWVQYNGKNYKVTKIGESAFEDCVGLAMVKIPGSVTEIGKKAFAGCSGLTSIVVDSENAIYDFRDNCQAIIETATNTLIVGCRNTVIPHSVTEIAGMAFCCSTGLISVRIPESVTEISNLAFCGCSGLASIVVERGNARYDSRNNCNAIIESSTNTLIAGCKNTMIPDSVTEIADFAFYGHCDLTSIVIPDSVTKIGGWAFAGCEGLKSVVIPDSMAWMGPCAFSGAPWERKGRK